MNAKSKFKENFHGILTHDGWIKVAKFNITAKILNIQGNGKIQVKGNPKKESYICNIHKNLMSDVRYMDNGDTVGVKWNCGKPYIVAYRKKVAEATVNKPTGDQPVSENMDWINIFKEEGAK